MVSLEEPGRVKSCPFVEHGSGVEVTSSEIKPHLSPLAPPLADKAKMVIDCYLCSIYLNIVKIYLLYR